MKTITLEKFNAVSSMSDEQCKQWIREHFFRPEVDSDWQSETPLDIEWYKQMEVISYTAGVSTTRTELRWIDFRENVVVAGYGAGNAVVRGYDSSAKITLVQLALLTQWQELRILLGGK